MHTEARSGFYQECQQMNDYIIDTMIKYLCTKW